MAQVLTSIHATVPDRVLPPFIREAARGTMPAMDTPIDHDTVAAIGCANCAACCCRLEVLLMGDDDIPHRFTAEDAWGGTVMRRLDDGWCAALDRNTLLCTIYERRPGICRDFAMGGSACIDERLEYADHRARS